MTFGGIWNKNLFVFNFGISYHQMDIFNPTNMHILQILDMESPQITFGGIWAKMAAFHQPHCKIKVGRKSKKIKNKIPIK